MKSGWRRLTPCRPRHHPRPNPPVAGWECDPGYYEDGEFCDCRCGAVDPDCTDAALPVDGCYEGQTCSADGAQCEGIPTDWTCEATARPPVPTRSR